VELKGQRSEDRGQRQRSEAGGWDESTTGLISPEASLLS
jgi:hypothetical protein